MGQSVAGEVAWNSFDPFRVILPYFIQSEQHPASGSGHFMRGLRSLRISAGVPRHVLNTEFTLRPTTPRSAPDLRIFIFTTTERICND